jgi:phosphohistidine swiveling domain-containing protein
MNLNKIKQDEWYRLGVEAVPLLINYGLNGVYVLIGEEDSLTICKGSHMFLYLRLNRLRVLANNMINNQLKDKTFVDSMIKEWQNKITWFDKNCQDIEKIKNLNNKELAEFIENSHKWGCDIWVTGFKLEAFDPLSDEVMQNLLDKYEKSGFSLEDFNEVCVFDEPSLIQRRQLDLIKIQKANQEKRDELIQKHLEDFKWIKTNFFESKILTKQEVLDELDKEIKVDLKYYEDLKQKKQNILDKHKPSKEILDIIYFFNKLSYWREIRKEMSLKINYFLNRIIEEIADRLNKPVELLNKSCSSEGSRFFEDKNFLDELKQRQEYWCSFKENDEFSLLGGEKALPYIKEFEALADPSRKLKGTTACKGKVTAKVKVLFGEKDFPNFNKGDIIVAVMTRPEYVPLMEKASAIITEEGGITCHASIISRELKIPCMVGVQNATTYLKDGDLVEVDADNGTVKKVSDE